MEVSDAGKYYCQAWSSGMTLDSDPFELKVNTDEVLGYSEEPVIPILLGDQ